MKIDFLFIIDNVFSFLDSNLSFGIFLIWAFLRMVFLNKQRSYMQEPAFQ